MNKIFKRIRVTYTVFAALEIIAVIIFGLYYYLNVYDFREVFVGTVATITTLLVIGINIVFLGVIIIMLYYFRQKSDLKAAQLIGEDVQEAYNFGMIGLVVVDEADNVIWHNDLFTDRNIKILNTNILTLNPRFRELKTATNNPNYTIKIIINQRYYEIKYLRSAKLYIFKDISDLETLYNYRRATAMVIGLIIIDNYSDVVDNSDDSNDIISKIRTAIFDYCKLHKVLLRRYRNDAYIGICDFNALSEIEKDQFSLLDQVHQFGLKRTTPPTLSISFAHGIDDAVKLYEMATDAIDIAMSRGGDQAAISTYGKDLRFFGGKNDAVEARNKVKVRVLADSLIATIKSAKNVIVLGHAYADMDAIGSCLGIMAMCKHFKTDCKMVYEPKLVEKKARAAFATTFSREEINKMTISPRDVIASVKPTTLVIMVDCHRPSLSMCPKLIDKSTKIVVIDHHRRSEEFVEMPVFSYIEPSASSASELIAELIHYASLNPPIDVSDRFATIMLSGIYLDSMFFKAKTTGIRTFEACIILKEFGADNAKADDFLKDEFEEYSLITTIASTLKTPHVGVVYCIADEKYIVEPATLAKVANQCLQMKGVNASFVIGKSKEDEYRISCRSDGTINVQLIAEKMGGGGHFTSAAVAQKNLTVKDGEKMLLETLDTYLNKARSSVNEGGK